MKVHGSYNLEKVLNFSGRLSKSLNLVKVLEKYLVSLLGLKKSLKFTTLFIPQKPVKLTHTVKTFLGMNNILLLFLYIPSDC